MRDEPSPHPSAQPARPGDVAPLPPRAPDPQVAHPGGRRSRRQTVRAIEHGGARAWIKHYGAGRRRLRLAALRWAATALGIPALKPPPRASGDALRRIELARLRTLRAAGVRVPDVLAHGPGHLILSDLGDSLAARLRAADAADAADLVARASQALLAAHARGAWLGQPMARNITIDASGRIGFVDFEEDPTEVMGVSSAQARDWLLFFYGIARCRPHDVADTAPAAVGALRQADREVLDQVIRAAQRLRFFAAVPAGLGRGAGALRGAARALREAVASGMLRLLPPALALDWLQDGDLDALEWLLRQLS